VKGKTDAPY